MIDGAIADVEFDLVVFTGVFVAATEVNLGISEALRSDRS